MNDYNLEIGVINSAYVYIYLLIYIVQLLVRHVSYLLTCIYNLTVLSMSWQYKLLANVQVTVQIGEVGVDHGSQPSLHCFDLGGHWHLSWY